MTEVSTGKPSPLKGLVGDFKALSAKQWAGIVIALVISLILEIYFSTSCFGFFIVAVLLYMIPHLLGVSSVKVKTVVGVVFIILALPILTFVFAGTMGAVQDTIEDHESEFIGDIQYDPETGDVTFTSLPYVTEDGTEADYEFVFQSYRIESLTTAVNGDRNSLFEQRFDPLDPDSDNYIEIGEDGLYHMTVHDVFVPEGEAYVMGAFVVVDNRSVDSQNMIYNNGASDTSLAFMGAGYTVLYAAVVFFIILIFSALMRRSADKTRAKMEAEGRLYPQGYGRCKNCGAMVLPGEINCRKCGAYIDVPDEMRVKKKDFFTCSECGAEVPADAKVCPKCGAAFDEEENEVVHEDGTVDVSSESVTCPECGNLVPANADWCPRCGRMLKKN